MVFGPKNSGLIRGKTIKRDSDTADMIVFLYLTKILSLKLLHTFLFSTMNHDDTAPFFRLQAEYELQRRKAAEQEKYDAVSRFLALHFR